MARGDFPLGLDPKRHQDLSGRAHHVWWRRAIVVAVAVVPVLGLLNVFGQHSARVTYSGAAASLAIDSPSRVRGGLIFTSEIVITPHRQLNDARLYLDNGWFQGMTFNGAAPQAQTESAADDQQVWDYGTLPAATPFHVWISWQANATNVGHHREAIKLYDGPIALVTAHRDLIVFP